MSDGEKIEYQELTKEEVAGILRKIADTVEGIASAEPSETTEAEEKETPGDKDLSVEGFAKLKISVEKEIDGFVLEIRKKSFSQKDDSKKEKSASKEQKKEYKNLKKRMKGDFKKIGEFLKNDLLPMDGVVASFLQDASEMLKYAEGDKAIGSEKNYAGFERACNEFRDSFEKKEIEPCKSAWREIIRIRKECHEE